MRVSFHGFDNSIPLTRKECFTQGHTRGTKTIPEQAIRENEPGQATCGFMVSITIGSNKNKSVFVRNHHCI